MDDKNNCRFWCNFFYVKTEDVVRNANDFPEEWNFARKYLSFTFLVLVVVWSLYFYVCLFCSADKEPLLLVADIHDWAARFCLILWGSANGWRFSRSLAPSIRQLVSFQSFQPLVRYVFPFFYCG